MQNAVYLAGSSTKTLQFVYTVVDGDNAEDIDVDSFNIDIKDIVGNTADTTSASPTTLSKQNIGVDTAPDLDLTVDGIAQGDVSGLNDINLNVSTVGANVASFNYKVVGDSNNCAVSSGYTNSVDMNPVALSVAAMSDGEVHICAVPVLTNGYIRTK